MKVILSIAPVTTLDNSGRPAWKTVPVTATGETSVERHEFVPKYDEVFVHDEDGNLASDGRWNYTWDGENRLVRMVARNSNPAVGPQQRIDFEYDWKGRRIGKKVWDNIGGTGNPVLDQKFVYDGWNLVGVLNSSFSVLNSFTWGLDLSGSLQGAGGVGGLLWVYDAAQASAHFAAYDGNGNVMALVNATDGAVSARYEYGPFGEVLRATGLMAEVNPFRFSTKYQDGETELLYYGYRYHDASKGRWLSKDPLGDQTFFEQYARGRSVDEIVELARNVLQAAYTFIGNNPIERIDILGLENVQIVVTTVIRPPDAQAGVKTIHAVVISEYGQIVPPVRTYVGYSIDPTGRPRKGLGVFWQGVSGSHPLFTVTMVGRSWSALLGSLLAIDYHLEIDLNFCARTGSLAGSHDGYPSYTVRIAGSDRYDFQQRTLGDLLPPEEVPASGEFSW